MNTVSYLLVLFIGYVSRAQNTRPRVLSCSPNTFKIMDREVWNPVEILILLEEHPEETIRVGRLIDLTGRQFRYIIDDQDLESGIRYDIDAVILNQKTLWITRAWKSEWVSSGK